MNKVLILFANAICVTGRCDRRWGQKDILLFGGNDLKTHSLHYRHFSDVLQLSSVQEETVGVAYIVRSWPPLFIEIQIVYMDTLLAQSVEYSISILLSQLQTAMVLMWQKKSELGKCHKGKVNYNLFKHDQILSLLVFLVRAQQGQKPW